MVNKIGPPAHKFADQRANPASGFCAKGKSHRLSVLVCSAALCLQPALGAAHAQNSPDSVPLDPAPIDPVAASPTPSDPTSAGPAPAPAVRNGEQAPAPVTQPDDGEPKPSENPGYTVRYEGVPKGLLPKFKILASVENKQRTFPTLTSLRRAARADRKAFTSALTAAGYYNGSVTSRVEIQADKKPAVVFEVSGGPAFQIVEHNITYQQQRNGTRPLTSSDAGLELSANADGVSLQSNQKAVLTSLWENGFPAARAMGFQVIADKREQTAKAIYKFESGEAAMFGQAQISGLERTRESYIEKLTTWELGSPYKKSTILDYRNQLASTNLFADIDVVPGQTDDDGTTPILVNLTERKHRTIGAGLFFSTTEGPGVRIFYENRNMFRRAETFRIDIEASEIEQSASAHLEKPLVGLPGSVFLQASFVNETTDAFDARTFDLAAGVSKRWFNNRLETRGGLALETSQIEPNNGGQDERFYFVSAPLFAIWDNENDILNPTKGVRASLSVTPYTGSESFTQIESNARTRFAWGREKRFITAFRGRLGATVGNELVDLPFNKRFFSGGGGSVRGFGFQLAGPIEVVTDIDGNVRAFPFGGRSAIEGAVEFRYGITDTIQVAAFSDIGSVSQTALPNFSERFSVGVGGGVRYLSPVGPLRIDLAFPVNPRPSDSSVQFLISLGQEF